ncbi:MAG TPA: hypothetical protein VF529_18100 [Solirubrobacteraceae bacterium]
MSGRRRLLAAPLLALAAMLALGAAPAHAVDCTTVVLTDPAGFDWSFERDGDARSDDHDGISAAGNVYFEHGYNAYYLRPEGSECSLEDGGRELVYPTQTVSGLETTGKVFVPAGGTAFVRHLWLFRNANPFPRRIHVRRWSSIDYATTAIQATSSGDAAVTTGDDWFTFANLADPTDPATAIVWQGPGVRRTAAEALYEECCEADEDPIANGFDEPQVRYERIDVPPGETVALMQFLLARPSAADAAAVAAQLAGGQAGALDGLSDDEVRAVRNFVLPDHDRDGVANEADDCLFVVNADQANSDGDPSGDACDADDDDDGLSDALEADFRTDPRRADTDGDGRSDRDDACPTTRSALPDGCPAFDRQETVSRYTGRLDPRSTSMLLTKRGRRLTATGSILPPDGLSAAQACAAPGSVEIAARKGRRSAGRRRARLKPDCSYAVALRATRRGRLRVSVRWLGNQYLKPTAIRALTRRVG